MIPTFESIENPETRHEWADHIIEGRMIVHHALVSEGIYLQKYIAWLRSMSNTQECLDLLNDAIHEVDADRERNKNAED